MVDSIVDAFFPFLTAIEKEVLEIDEIAFSDDMMVTDKKEVEPESGRQSQDIRPSPPAASAEGTVSSEQEKHISTAPSFEKAPLFASKEEATRATFDLSFPPPRLVLRRIRRHVRHALAFLWHAVADRFKPNDENLNFGSARRTLRRMARTRRLVTTLSRLLATKSEVVARMQKRLLQTTADEINRSLPPSVQAPAPAEMAGATVAQAQAQAGAEGMNSDILASSAGGIGAIPMSEAASANSNRNGGSGSEATDIAIYYGDVQG
jgi:Mg2+ and Co2+ transporter CorA